MSNAAISIWSDPLHLRPCPLCDAHDSEPVFDAIKRCKNCGLRFVSPLGCFRGENETPDYFLKEYLPLHNANWENSLAERRAHLEMIQDYFALPPRPRLLDVGCALGFMLREAKAVGWEPTGLETSPFAAEYAAQETNCPVIAGTLQQANFESGSFDVVTLMDVIEHVAEPRGLISEIYRVLRPGGVLFVITPNFSSLFIKLYGPLAYGVGAEEHVTYFQPSTISRLLRQANFRRVITGSKDLYAANLGRLLGHTRDARIKGAFGNRVPLSKLRGIANRLLMHVKVGDKLIALARK